MLSAYPVHTWLNMTRDWCKVSMDESNMLLVLLGVCSSVPRKSHQLKSTYEQGLFERAACRLLQQMLAPGQTQHLPFCLTWCQSRLHLINASALESSHTVHCLRRWHALLDGQSQAADSEQGCMSWKSNSCQHLRQVLSVCMDDDHGELDLKHFMRDAMATDCTDQLMSLAGVAAASRLDHYCLCLR